MKRLLLACALALFATPALAASYTLTTTAAQESAITVARNAFNAGLSGGAADPNFQATNGAFLLSILNARITDFLRRQQVQATLPATDQTNALTLLNACVSANGLGGLTTAQCQALLAEVQAAPNVQ